MKSTTLAIFVSVVVLVGMFWYLKHSNNDSLYTNKSALNQTSTTNTADSHTSPNTNPTPSQALLSTGSNVTVGTYLVASNGMTLYIDKEDTPGVSKCAGLCLANWPPYAVSDNVKSDEISNVNRAIPGALGTIDLSDGRTQLTYKGMALYFWVQDKKIGDVTGDKIGNFLVARP